MALPCALHRGLGEESLEIAVKHEKYVSFEVTVCSKSKDKNLNPKSLASQYDW